MPPTRPNPTTPRLLIKVPTLSTNNVSPLSNRHPLAFLTERSTNSTAQATSRAYPPIPEAILGSSHGEDAMTGVAWIMVWWQKEGEFESTVADLLDSVMRRRERRPWHG